MHKKFPASRWLIPFIILLLVTVTACVRSKPSPTPIPTETTAASVETDVTPTGGTPTVVGIGNTPQETQTSTESQATPEIVVTPAVVEVVPSSVPAPTEEPITQPGATPAQSGQVASYIVQPGDTLYSIAHRFNTTSDAIMQLNNLSNPNSLEVGQTLLIPGTTQAGGTTPSGPAGQTTYTVQVGDTMFSIAKRFNTTVDAIARTNHILNPWYIHVGQQLVIPAGSGTGRSEGTAPSGSGQKAYTVQVGDTLWSIATRFGTTPQTLATLNHLSSFSFIYPGQVLQLP